MKKRILFLLQLPPPTYGAAIVGQEIRDSKLINETFDATYLNIVLTRDLNHPGAGVFPSGSLPLSVFQAPRNSSDPPL